jgi:arylsulfatase A-like enzyme
VTVLSATGVALGLAALAAGALAIAGCSGRSRPSVLLVSIDSFRHDELDNVVDGKPVAPRLSALAKESLRFDRTVASAPWTTPSMMSVMTGLPPRAHGVAGYDRTLASSVPQLAQRFKDAGYQTAAFVPAATLRKAFGFGPGFDTYDVTRYGHDQISSPTLVGKVVAKLTAWRSKPFFVWVHLWDPHYDYNPPGPYDQFQRGEKPPSEDVQCLRWYVNAVTPPQAEFLRGRFQGEMLYTDFWFGRLLDEMKTLELDERTVLLVMGDHGEAFLEHGWLTHANRIDEPVVRVPLLLRWPGRIEPRRDDTVVSTEQVGRTLLQLAGLDGSTFGMAEALPLKVDERRPAGGDDTAMTETIRDGCFTGLVGPRYKYVVEHVSCSESLFDLQADPGEAQNLAGAQPDVLALFRQRLKARLTAIAAAKIPLAAQPPEVVQELEAALRSIGYVGGKGDDARAEPGCAVAPGATRPPAMGEIGGPECPPDGALRCLE